MVQIRRKLLSDIFVNQYHDVLISPEFSSRYSDHNPSTPIQSWVNPQTHRPHTHTRTYTHTHTHTHTDIHTHTPRKIDRASQITHRSNHENNNNYQQYHNERKSIHSTRAKKWLSEKTVRTVRSHAKSYGGRGVKAKKWRHTPKKNWDWFFRMVKNFTFSAHKIHVS